MYPLALFHAYHSSRLLLILFCFAAAIDANEISAVSSNACSTVGTNRKLLLQVGSKQWEPSSANHHGPFLREDLPSDIEAKNVAEKATTNLKAPPAFFEVSRSTEEEVTPLHESDAADADFYSQDDVGDSTNTKSGVLNVVLCLIVVAFTLGFSLMQWPSRKLQTLLETKPQAAPQVDPPKPKPKKPHASFTIPAVHCKEHKATDKLAFGVSRCPVGERLQAELSFISIGNTLAKIDLSQRVPNSDCMESLVSCSVVSTLDMEHHNVQGTLLSWMSLFRHEEPDSRATCAEARLNLVGIAGHFLNPTLMDAVNGRNILFEFFDGLGELQGTLENTTMPAQFSFQQKNRAEIIAEVNMSKATIVFSQLKEEMAVVRNLGSQESIQMDLVDGIDPLDAAYLLICAIAISGFKLAIDVQTRCVVTANPHIASSEFAAISRVDTSNEDINKTHEQTLL